MNRNKQELKKYLEETRQKLLTPKDQARFEKIIKKVDEIWNTCNLPYPYPKYDSRHCQRIEEKIYQILPSSSPRKLHTDGWFLLLTAIWLQDVGMCPTLFGLEDSSRLLEIGEYSWIEYVREHHANRSAEYIKNHIDKIENLDKFDQDEIHDLSIMCLWHRVKAYQELYSEECASNNMNVNLPLLIAYLRLADSLHIPDSDAVDDVDMHLLIAMDKTARFYWFKSRYVKSTTVFQDQYLIEVIIKRPINIAPEDIDPAQELVREEIQDQLDSIKDILLKGGPSLYLTVKCTNEQETAMNTRDTNRLRELLANIQSFDPIFTPSASLVIHNITEQLKTFIDYTNPEGVLDNLHDYNMKTLFEIINERPCHVLLKKLFSLLRFLLASSHEPANRLRIIENSLNNFLNKRREALELLPMKTVSIISEASSILLYGYSRTVVSCLKYYLENVKSDVTVYVCEARTKSQYRFNNRLIYSDCIKYLHDLKMAEDLTNDIMGTSIKKRNQLNVVLVPDACASKLFATHTVSTVLLGANGINLSGYVGHTLGHLAIADMARIYKVPVYVLADSMKIGHFQEKPEIERKNDWLTTDIQFVPLLTRCKSYNPREDIVPPERIEAIVTEKGRIPPDRISEHYEADWLERITEERE